MDTFAGTFLSFSQRRQMSRNSVSPARTHSEQNLCQLRVSDTPPTNTIRFLSDFKIFTNRSRSCQTLLTRFFFFFYFLLIFFNFPSSSCSEYQLGITNGLRPDASTNQLKFFLSTKTIFSLFEP